MPPLDRADSQRETVAVTLKRRPLNQVVSLLSRFFHKAQVSGNDPAGDNPCRFIEMYRIRSCERVPSEQAFERLGRVLGELESAGRISTSAAAVLRLLMLTECRRNEILNLRREHVDLVMPRPARVPFSCLTAKRVPTVLSHEPGNPCVIFGRWPGSRLYNLNVSWEVVCREAGLKNVRTHDLRHSFTSRALAFGESLPMVGKLLGYREVQTTARYAQIALHPAKVTAARISDRLATGMDTASDSRMCRVAPPIRSPPYQYRPTEHSERPARISIGAVPRDELPFRRP